MPSGLLTITDPDSGEAHVVAQTNAHGTLLLLEAARRGGVGRVIYGSTVWVYGESGEGVLDEEAPLVLPRHIYTASKLAGEMYCASYAELYDAVSGIWSLTGFLGETRYWISRFSGCAAKWVTRRLLVMLPPREAALGRAAARSMRTPNPAGPGLPRAPPSM